MQNQKRKNSSISVKRLDPKANQALDSIERDNHKARAEHLRAIEPWAALLLLCCKLEMQLKLFKYSEKMKDGWPTSPKFWHGNWTLLQQLKNSKPDEYKQVIDNGNPDSLLNFRNLMAHTGLKVSAQKAETYWEAVLSVMVFLNDRMPSRQSLQERRQRMRA